jgi:hypothetical protein
MGGLADETSIYPINRRLVHSSENAWEILLELALGHKPFRMAGAVNLRNLARERGFVAYEEALETSSIRRIIKRATRRAGLDISIAGELSGHSMRIGAAQDMMVAGFDALAIMQAGGWNSANVVL